MSLHFPKFGKRAEKAWLHGFRKWCFHDFHTGKGLSGRAACDFQRKRSASFPDHNPDPSFCISDQWICSLAYQEETIIFENGELYE